MSKHRKFWAHARIARDLAEDSPAEPRHKEPHVHVFTVIAEFDGLRAAIGECRCGDTRTMWAEQ